METIVETRFKMQEVEPEGYKVMLNFEKYLSKTDLTPTFRNLINIRASQLNGCAYCVDMHTKEAREAGETERRLYSLPVWREVPFFTEEERVVLAITEEVTFIANRVSDATYNKALQLFGEKQTAQIMFAAIVMNAWNRIGVATNLIPAE